MSKTSLAALGVLALVAAAGSAAAASSPAQKCAGSIRKCCGKLFSAVVACHVKAAKSATDTTDQGCIDKAGGKYDSCANKALGKGGCVVGQAEASHLKDEIVNEWAADVKADLPIVAAP
jgi:hypothetical protein